MFTKQKTTLTLMALAMSTAMMTSAEAATFQDFKVDETWINDSWANPVAGALEPLFKNFEADKISGRYSEIFSVTAPGKFAVTAIADFGNYSSNDGLNNVAPIGLGSMYGLYGVFIGTGNISADGKTFTGLTGDMALYIDNYNTNSLGGDVTVKPLPAFGGINPIPFTTNFADDILLASTSTLVGGTGNNFPGQVNAANGDFSITLTDLNLSAAGKKYFYSPDPFHMVITFDGNFSSFDIPAPGSSTVNPITGAANIFYEKVPEPETLALLGIGLLSMTAGFRRKA